MKIYSEIINDDVNREEYIENLVDRCKSGGMSDTPRGRVAVANAPALLIRVENAFATKDCLCVATSIARACSSYNEPAKGCSIEAMKNVVKIVEVTGINKTDDATIVNINLDQQITVFKKDDDGVKQPKRSHQLSIRMSDYKRLLMSAEGLLQLDTKEDKDLMKAFAQHNKLLIGATLELNREEVKAKPTNDEGEEVDGEEALVGFGESSYKVTLTKTSDMMLSKLLEAQIQKEVEEMNK